MIKQTPLAAEAVVIIGAARSGTNMLRDVITSLPGYATWPCDEINYIWRHGNRAWPDDELVEEHARPAVVNGIRRAFNGIARQTGAATIVEKTCANSLRVRFVDRVVPEAKYIFITRDGRDVVASALKRWTAPLDIPYLMAKARYVPPTDLPYYGFRYLGNRLYRLASGGKRLAFWGPQFNGITEELKRHPLPVVGAMQWARSVERALDDFQKIDPTRVHSIRYEDFVADPTSELARLGRFLSANFAEADVRRAAAQVSTSSVGKWKTDLDPETAAAIAPHVDPVLHCLGHATR